MFSHFSVGALGSSDLSSASRAGVEPGRSDNVRTALRKHREAVTAAARAHTPSELRPPPAKGRTLLTLFLAGQRPKAQKSPSG